MAQVASNISGKKWDGDGVPLADSNMANVGSEEDKAVRLKAAQGEPAWEGIGMEPGIKVFRIENFQVVPYPEKSYGEFYSGDSYIVLRTEKDPESGKISHNIHFWLGKNTTTDEMGTAAYKTVELDDFFGGEPTQHREVQNNESMQFKQMFKTIRYLDGGVETGFHHAAEGSFKSKLLRVRKTNTDGIRVQEVTLARESLNQGDCFILDTGAKIYVWCGEESSAFEKKAANDAAENIENTRDGKANTTTDIDDAFWGEVGGSGDIAPAIAGKDKVADADPGEGSLFKLSDTSGSLKTTLVARGDIGPGMLDSSEVMMLDTDVEIFLWIGKDASAGEARNSMATAMAYLKTNNKPTQTPIHLFKEGSTIKNAVWSKVMASGPAKAPAPAAAPPTADEAPSRLHTNSPAPTAASDAAAGTMPLAELQDSKIWKAKGVDPGSRELHLSDEEFKATFGVDKGAWAKMPKWKKDGEKKKHGLF